jgi:AraC-like DNA-binding protein
MLYVGFAELAARVATAAAQARGGLSPHALRRMREYIDSNIDRRIKVETLAKLANLSVCYFTRAFKQSIGVPFETALWFFCHADCQNLFLGRSLIGRFWPRKIENALFFKED